MRRMTKGHLDQTLSEAVNRLTGKYDADVRDYDRIHRHILMMADSLSDGSSSSSPSLPIADSDATDPNREAGDPEVAGLLESDRRR